MKLNWKKRKDALGHYYKACLPDGSDLTLSPYGIGWDVRLYVEGGYQVGTLILTSPCIDLDASGHPTGDDSVISEWVASHFPLLALAALAPAELNKDEHTNGETSCP